MSYVSFLPKILLESYAILDERLKNVIYIFTSRILITVGYRTLRVK